MALGTPGFSNIDGGGGGGGAGVPLNFSQTKGAQVTITAAEAKPATVVSVTITTAGNPVQIIVSGDANPSGAGTWGLLNIYRGAVAIGQNVQFESSAANENVPYSLQVVDEPAAGTWTYSLKVVSVTANTQFGESAGPIITVTELGGVGTAVPSGAAGGDLGGTYPNPDVVAIQGYSVSTTAPGAGEALVWDGSNWVPTAVSAGAGGNNTNIQYNSGSSLAGTNNFIFDDTLTRVTLTDGSQALDVYPNLIEYVGGGSLQIEASTTVDVGTLTATGVNLGSATAATTIAGAFTLPTADGASGEVLTTDGSGNVSWQAGGGGGSIGGTILATEVAFGTALDTVSGSSTFTYDSLNNTVALDKGTNLSGILVRDTPLTVTSDLQAGALVLNSSTEGATLSGTGVFLEMRYDTLVGQIPTIRAIDETTAAAPLDLSIGELRLNTAPGAAGEVLTSNGPGLAPTWQAGGGGSGAAGAANEIQYNDGSNALTASSGLTFDGTTLAVNSIGPSAFTVSSTIDGQFLDVNTSLYQLTLLDPTQLPLNVNATLGPSDLAIFDDNVNQSGNVQAGLVGVFDNATTNNLKMIIPAGVATIKSEDALSAAQALNLSIAELQVNTDPGTSGYVLTSNGAGSAPTWQAGGVGFGSRVHLVVEGGSYATLQAAVDAAATNDVILVGPKGGVSPISSWGDVTFPAGKRLSVVGLMSARGQQANIGKVTFSPVTGANILENSVFLENLFIDASFAGSQGVNFAGTAPARLRIINCTIYNLSAVSGDAIVVNNSGAGSSCYIDGTVIQSAGTAGVAINHVQGYTIIKNRTEVSDYQYQLQVAAGTVEILQSTFEGTLANEVIRVTGGLVTMGYSNIKNLTTNSSGVNMTTAGAAFLMGFSTFTIATGTGYCVNGVAGTVFLNTTNSYSNSALAAYNVKVKNTITSQSVTATFTSSP